VALSLIQTGEFANPYLIPTGLTAHMPPLQVGVMALLYKVVGYSYLGGLVRWLLVMAAHAMIFALLPWLGGRLGMGREVGVLGGLGGALIPHWPYELESFSALALGSLLVAFLNRWGERSGSGVVGGRGRGTSRGAVTLGLAAGIAFHFQPVLLPVVLGCLAFELWWWRDRRKWGGVSLVAFFWGGPLHRFPTVPAYLLLTLLALLGAWRVLPSLGPHQRAIFLIPLFTYPLIYYIVAYMPRYGYPVRWLLFLLAGSAVWGWIGGEVSSEKVMASPEESDAR